MSRTERDVMRARRWLIWQEIERQHPADYPHQWTYQRQAVFDKALRIAHVYDHVCSPFCLMHWAKRHARRRDRHRAKAALRRQTAA